ncbi:MAG: excinuclease ABC subunit A [Deltaproteobacteria bacterium]|nr:excinuclease ABC subunit A [Deltaproteobacteria bacterium]
MSASIHIRGACQNNLKNLNIDIALNTITVITGLSGSGKSSLAFDTLYAEGQRRYIESFSTYARQFMDRMDKPAVDGIDGILPAIAVTQSNPIKTSRSTLGTLTEINDYLKLLFPRMAVLHCETCGRAVEQDSAASIAERLLRDYPDQRCIVTFPFAVTPEAPISPEEIERGLKGQAFYRVLHDNATIELSADFIARHVAFDLVADRLSICREQRSRLIDSLESALKFGKGLCSVYVPDTGAETLKFSIARHCPHCDTHYRPATAALFSFNNPLGACPQCNGFGRTIILDVDAAIPDQGRSLQHDAIKPWSTPAYREAYADLMAYCRKKNIPATVPFRELSSRHKRAIIDGNGDFYGVRGFFTWLETKSYKMHIRVMLSKYRAYAPCPACGGTRFTPETLLYRLAGRTIADIHRMSIAEAAGFFAACADAGPDGDETAALLLREIRGRLGYLNKVGLGYLSLDRQSRTLSGGEVARASLTCALGSSLVNTLYVLDEPSIGLHPRDTHLLLDVLQALRDLGNTVVIVEHDPDIIARADRVIDLGPRSGENGGRLLYAGPPEGIVHAPASLTGDYAAGRRAIALPGRRRSPDSSTRLRIRGARCNNLQNLNLDIPLGLFVCITGVSGSGKSTLLEDVIHQDLSAPGERVRCCRLEGSAPRGVICMDQAPIGRTPRSNPATYIKIFDSIRALFAAAPLAVERGYTASTFSFNARGGRCETCQGEGFEKIEMQFLADTYVTCSACGGTRYAPHVLDVACQGRNIHEVLQLTVAQARAFFAGTPKIEYPLRLLDMVGLGYLRLGQPATTLSGGESQRLKLAAFIRQGSAEKTLFLFDEPTTGLHTEDISNLLTTFDYLISQGHSIIVVEHNPDLIQRADYIIDLGPEGGCDGGRIIVAGTPEEVMACAASHTGRYLIKARERRVPHAQSPSVPVPAPPVNAIVVEGAREHNLRNVSLAIPRDRLVVISGLSGSGKSTLAFDILFAEGQRRFLETLSPYARQYVTQLKRPDVDSVRGLPPAVAIDQLLSRGGRKSTVATATEIYHYLRLLFARLGELHCPGCGRGLSSSSAQDIAGCLERDYATIPVKLLAPVVRGRKGLHHDIIQKARQEGFDEIRIDGQMVLLRNIFAVKRYHEHKIELVTCALTPATTAAQRLLIEVERTLAIGRGEMLIVTADLQEHFFSTRAFCPACRLSVAQPDPRLFSFNSRSGACPECDGYGSTGSLDPGSMIADRSRSIAAGALAPLESALLGPAVRARLLQRIEQAGICVDTAFNQLSASAQRALLQGGKKFAGLAALLSAPALLKKAGWQEYLEQFHVETACSSCNGARINAQARSVRINGKSIHELTAMTAPQLLDFLTGLAYTGRSLQIARPIMQELLPKLELLHKAGLSYLRLDRGADTLSGGEAQRMRLSAQVASNLRGALYVLDEPTIGLHPHDTRRMLAIIRELQARGNSVIVVEHDEDTIRAADHIIDLGPGGGRSGGTVIACGTLQEIMADVASLTGAHLAGRMPPAHQTGARPLAGCERLQVRGARAHNLKKITVGFPLGRLSVVTGVSGSGKTTLVRETLYKALQKHFGRYHGPAGSHAGLRVPASLKKAVEIDQSPIGKTPRSIPATYMGIYDAVRALFAKLPDARVRGYSPGRFSFNLNGGRCEACAGQGEIKIAMSFMPDMYVECDRCRGRRFNEETCQICYRDKNIAQVLGMTIDEARVFFSDVPAIAQPLEFLCDMGLGYLGLGQPSPTLSGGEAQRIKIAAALSKPTQGKTLYVLDEPTTGLHPADVIKLMRLIQRLVDLGNTVIIIEHNLEVMRQSDYIIDLGSGGGDAGGRVVACGSPEKIAAADPGQSCTAVCLREYILRHSN